MTANNGAPSKVTHDQDDGDDSAHNGISLMLPPRTPLDGLRDELPCDQRERDRHDRLEPPRRDVAEHRVAELARVADECPRSPSECGADGRAEHIGAYACDDAQPRRQPAGDGAHRDMPPVAAGRQRAE